MNWSRRISTLYNFSFQKNANLLKAGFLRAKEMGQLPHQSDFVSNVNGSILELFEEKLSKDQSMFEYGSGKSTTYLAQRIKHVTSVTQDELIFKELKDEEYITLRLYGNNRNYANAIVSEGPEKLYDLISVNGRHRAACAINAFEQLTPNGILILNDSDVEHNQQVFEYYKKKGYQDQSFASCQPIGNSGEITTIFYNSENCFGL